MARVSGNREKIMEAAWELFWRQGYHASSIQDIARAAKLPKGSVYNYFASKEELLLHALERIRYQTETLLRLRVLSGTPSPSEIVLRLLQHYEELYAAHGYGRGDPLASRINELADGEPELVAKLHLLADVWRGVVTQKIWAYATVAGVPQLVERAPGLAAMIYCQLQGVLLEMKATRSAEPLLEARRTLVPMVEGFVSAVATGELPTEAS
jgi:TetR/AcrR family transcriptional regulator, transcriptional repressor for nem operon